MIKTAVVGRLQPIWETPITSNFLKSNYEMHLAQYNQRKTFNGVDREDSSRLRKPSGDQFMAPKSYRQQELLAELRKEIDNFQTKSRNEFHPKNISKIQAPRLDAGYSQEYSYDLLGGAKNSRLERVYQRKNLRDRTSIRETKHWSENLADYLESTEFKPMIPAENYPRGVYPRRRFHPLNFNINIQEPKDSMVEMNSIPQMRQPSLESPHIGKPFRLRNNIKLKEIDFESQKTKFPKACPICLEDFDEEMERVTKISNAGWAFHDQCLKNYILHAVKDKAFPINYPMEGTQRVISRGVLQRLLDEDEWKLYNKQKLISDAISNPDIYTFCPTPDCEHIFKLPEGTKLINTQKCPQCQQNICLVCKTIMHLGISCHEYQLSQQEGDGVQEFLKAAKCKKCMKCNYWIEKNEGCNHMTCKCKNEFCFVCGAKWKTCSCQTNDIQDQDWDILPVERELGARLTHNRPQTPESIPEFFDPEMLDMSSTSTIECTRVEASFYSNDDDF